MASCAHGFLLNYVIIKAALRLSDCFMWRDPLSLTVMEIGSGCVQRSGRYEEWTSPSPSSLPPNMVARVHMHIIASLFLLPDPKDLIAHWLKHGWVPHSLFVSIGTLCQIVIQ